MATLVLADDKKRFRETVKDLLMSYPVKILAEAGNGKELLEVLNTKKPDIILLDLEMPVMNGSEALEVIRQKFPALKVIILSMHYELELIDDYIARGARAYLPKDDLSAEVLMQAIGKVQAGDTFVFKKPKSRINPTRGQSMLMPLMFNNHTNEEIAERLLISTRTVERQRRSLYKKTGAATAIDFYKFAFSKGLQFLGIRKKT